MILKVSTVFRRKCGIYSQSEDPASVPDCYRLSVLLRQRDSLMHWLSQLKSEDSKTFLVDIHVRGRYWRKIRWMVLLV